MSKRRIETASHPQAEITAQALGFEASEDLLPEIVELLSAAGDGVAALLISGDVSPADNVAKLLPGLAAVGAKLGKGRLRAIASALTAGTSIVITDDAGAKEKYDLVNRAERQACFDARPDLYFPAMILAFKVTYTRFFPALARAATAGAGA